MTPLQKEPPKTFGEARHRQELPQLKARCLRIFLDHYFPDATIQEITTLGEWTQMEYLSDGRSVHRFYFHDNTAFSIFEIGEFWTIGFTDFWALWQEQQSDKSKNDAFDEAFIIKKPLFAHAIQLSKEDEDNLVEHAKQKLGIIEKLNRWTLNGGEDDGKPVSISGGYAPPSDAYHEGLPPSDLEPGLNLMVFTERTKNPICVSISPRNRLVINGTNGDTVLRREVLKWKEVSW